MSLYLPSSLSAVGTGLSDLSIRARQCRVLQLLVQLGLGLSTCGLPSKQCRDGFRLVSARQRFQASSSLRYQYNTVCHKRTCQRAASLSACVCTSWRATVAANTRTSSAVGRLDNADTTSCAAAQHDTSACSCAELNVFNPTNRAE